LFLF
jgi:hypothetical protein